VGAGSRRQLPAWVRRIDAADARRRNRHRPSPTVDARLRGLSKAANKGVLWFAVAGALALTGKRGRRAAVRGLVSLGVSSMLANLVGKNLVGGVRPLLDEVPLARRLSKPPSSPAFPSGHTASAAGFVTGAAIESPATALVLAPIGAAVAYSRLHTGSHWLSDVAGGLAIGLGVGALGRVFSPPPDHGPAGTPADVPALPRGRGLFVVVNSHSGRGALRLNPVSTLRRTLPDAVIHELSDGESVADALNAGIRTHAPKAIGACGGDGTIGAAAQVALQSGLPFAVFPGGTLNHFSKAAGIESLYRAARAVTRGTGIRVNIATARIDDDEPFVVLNTSSIGIYPELVAEREALENRIGKWPAALVAAARVVPRVSPVRFITPERDLEAWLAFIGVGRYHPQTIIPRSRHRLDDGLLDVRVVRADVTRSRARMFTNLALGGTLTGALRRIPSLARLLGVETSTRRELDFTVNAGADGEGFAHDGEASPPRQQYRVRIGIDDRLLRIYAPLHR